MNCWRQYGEAHPPSLLLLFNPANLYILQGKPAKAEVFYQKAKDLSTQLYGENPICAVANMQLGCLLLASYRFTEAEELLQRNLEVFQRMVGPENCFTLLVERMLRNCRRLTV